MKIGILGGGQLARMILESGYRYGFEFHIFFRRKKILRQVSLQDLKLRVTGMMKISF